MPRKIGHDDIDRFHDYSVHMPTRTIYMGSTHVSESYDFAESGCDAFMAERFIKNMHLLESISLDPITVILNNPGGDEYHCFAIFDAIKNSKAEVTIKVLGHAMSAGSMILQAADKRIMSANSRQMIHYGTWGTHDHAKTTQKHAEEGLKIDKWIERMYLSRIQEKNPNFTLKKLKKMLDHDTFLTAKESVELGLADEVVGEEE